MSDFIRDFAGGKQDGRYLPAELPYLPFTSFAFELALCSHFSSSIPIPGLSTSTGRRQMNCAG
jgi:hypothetical protein